MPFYKNMFAIGAALGLGLFQLANAQETTSAQLFIGNTCGTANTKDHYFLYTWPVSTSKCITIGAPGYPFFSEKIETQCGDYTNGGASYAECNNYPQDAVAVQLSSNIACTFYSSQDCTEDERNISWSLSSADTTNCEDFPPRLPLNVYKQTVSSFTCVNI